MEKPTGETGFNKMSKEKNRTTNEFHKIDFSQTKEEIESFIVETFIDHAKKRGFLPDEQITTKQNDLDDLDFTLIIAEEEVYLELMEIAPLEKHKGGYENAPNRFNSYEFAEEILSKIQGKSEKYDGTTEKSIYLLTYVTDWKFNIGASSINLLQYWTLKQDHTFGKIFYYKPSSKKLGIPYIIYPTPKDHWNRFDPEDYRDSETINLDPEGWK